jgi:hypothetical protein
MVSTALQLNTVSRLTDTWKVKLFFVTYNYFLLPVINFFKSVDNRTQRRWFKIETLVNPLRNYKAFREHLSSILSSKTSLSILPHFGTIFFPSPTVLILLALTLKDITFADDGNPSFVEDRSVNFDKFRLIAAILSPVTAMQKTPQTHTSNLVLRSYLMYDTLVLDSDEQYERSKSCQPLKVHASLSNETLSPSSSSKLSRTLSRLNRTNTSANLADLSKDPRWGAPIASGKFTKTIQRMKSATDISSGYKSNAALPITPPTAKPRRSSDESVNVGENFTYDGFLTRSINSPRKRVTANPEPEVTEEMKTLQETFQKLSEMMSNLDPNSKDFVMNNLQNLMQKMSAEQSN